MNLKTMMSFVLVFLMVVGMIAYGYLVYILRADATPQAGAALVSSHQLMFYSFLVIQILELITAGLIAYKS